MDGNVSEWVENVWHDIYEGAPKDGSAWLQDGEPWILAVRGGSWRHNPLGPRAATRLGITSGSQVDNLGFRVGRTLTP